MWIQLFCEGLRGLLEHRRMARNKVMEKFKTELGYKITSKPLNVQSKKKMNGAEWMTNLEENKYTPSFSDFAFGEENLENCVSFYTTSKITKALCWLVYHI